MQIEQKGDQIVVTIDVSEAALKAAKPSSTGKTLLVATTNGFRRQGRCRSCSTALCLIPARDCARNS
jgi:hypothetical protein